MRIFYALVFFLIIAFLHMPDAVAQAQCPLPPAPPRLIFVTEHAPASYDNSRDIYAMRDAVRLGYVVAGKHDQLLGLTASRLNYALSGKTQILRTPAGFCVSLTEVKVTFGYQAMDVFIAKEYAPDTCEHSAILDHENQHVAINYKSVADYLPQVKREFEIQLRQSKPLLARSAQQGSDQALKNLQESVQPVFEDLQRLLAHRNAQIDTHMSYSAVAKKCENWAPGQAATQ